MEYMEKIKKMLCNELEEFSEQRTFSVADLDKIQKISDTIKNIDKIGMLENDGYSEHYPYYGGSSYSRRGTHYVRGHYSRNDGENDYSENYDRRYSNGEAKDKMMSKLGEMMEGANPNEREILKHAMRKLEDV